MVVSGLHVTDVEYGLVCPELPVLDLVCHNWSSKVLWSPRVAVLPDDDLREPCGFNVMCLIPEGGSGNLDICLDCGATHHVSCLRGFKCPCSEDILNLAKW